MTNIIKLQMSPEEIAERQEWPQAHMIVKKL